MKAIIFECTVVCEDSSTRLFTCIELTRDVVSEIIHDSRKPQGLPVFVEYRQLADEDQ